MVIIVARRLRLKQNSVYVKSHSTTHFLFMFLFILLIGKSIRIDYELGL